MLLISRPWVNRTNTISSLRPAPREACPRRCGTPPTSSLSRSNPQTAFGQRNRAHEPLCFIGKKVQRLLPVWVFRSLPNLLALPWHLLSAYTRAPVVPFDGSA